MAKLPQSMTTVTRVSKLVAMVLFIVFPFIGFYLGMQYQKMITPAYPPTVYEAPQKANTMETLGKMCGGIGGLVCKDGYKCQLDGNYPDAGGTCVPDTSSDPSRQPARDLPASVAPDKPTSMCTMDAKQCPDGSWVGRSGPNCEFVCPK